MTFCSKCKESEEFIRVLQDKIADLEQQILFEHELDEK